MRNSVLATALAATSLLASASLFAADEGTLKAGCAPGERLKVFSVQAITGPDKGKTLCYI